MGDDPTPSSFTIGKTTPYVKVVRRSYAESFTSAGMRGIFEKEIEVLNKGMLYLKEWQHEDTIDIQEFFRRLMLDLAGKAELDMNLGGLDNSKPIYKLLIECGHHASSFLSNPLLELKTKIFPSSKVARKINQDFDDMIGEWTKIANEVVNRGEPDENDISVAANLRRVKMPGTDEPLPFNLLRSELATAIIGGFDTMSHQLSWIFALLATNPSVVDKLLDELRVHDLYGDGAKEFQFEDVSELKYLTAVVKEGMRRIHIATVAGARIAPQDLILGGHRIPRNTLFYICSNGSMNCEMEWEDHLAFKPERWLDGNLNIKEKYYVPFGLGERDCVGMKLAMLSMKVAIVYFIRKFSFELVGDTIESLLENSVSGFVLESGKGINMRMTPRKNKLYFTKTAARTNKATRLAITTIRALVFLGYFLLKELWMRWHYDLHKIPTPPKLPLLGHALQLKPGTKNSAMNVWVQKWRAKLGFPKLIRLCLMGHTFVIVTDIDIARKLALSKANIRVREGPMIRHLHRLNMGNDPTPSSFTIQKTTPYVKTIRRSYAASFTSAGMRDIFEKLIEVLDKGILYLEKRQHQDTVDIQEFFGRLKLDLVGKAELDMNLGGFDNSKPIYKLLIECGHHMTSLYSVPLLELRTKYFPNSKTKMANEVVNRGEPDEKDISVAANFKRARMPGTNDPLPFNLLRGELATAIIGGFDTTSHQLSWIFALLATNPSVVDKLLDELRAHGLYGDGAKDIKFEDLSQLEYLTAVVKEGMRRIHIAVAVAAKASSQDIVLGGYRIPRDTLLLISGNLSMNCELEWEDHLAFKPKRWLSSNINLKDKYYVPFGLGERDCVGMKLAMQSMKLVIVYFITRFSFSLVGDTIESLVEIGVAGIVFEAEKGINMKIIPRLKNGTND
eukprot:g323.t1